ncbi:hypothetical protein FisN_4Lh255 [Fistulifera solaris]|uniref:Protein kinase domain-containing protein n=1 Tax=Fistulifera solaris TaxID=1519565 RepID=A0A1Z5KCX9_FISSO|nr:hypothetical protein FisN_4Lh255 [Fistulifera solaris]|eukprot:GAX24170.1 hypothetical protein FisN_4Lh255 [Fistulifera solaris]
MVHFRNSFLPHLHDAKPRHVATPDYGGLKIQFLAEENAPRAIDVLQQQNWPPHDRDTDENDIDTYYAFDDDIVRNPYSEYDDDSIRTSKHCRRVAWHRKLPINCNLIHELDFLNSIQDGHAEYAGEGAYRQVHLLQLDQDPLIAFKKYRWDAAYDFRDLEFMRMDAVVAEVMSTEPDIVDIYGFCALAIVNEGILGGDLEEIATPIEIERGKFIENDKSGQGLQPLNNLTATEKILYSLEMAEALSKLHAYPGGVIVHDDIHLGQFLIDDLGHLKLQDFNRAEIMLWNEEDGEYCRYRNNPGDGEFRAPEEYLDRPLNEKIDVWSLGINMYYVLTGSTVLPEAKTTEEYQERIMKGEKPPIDPRFRERSFAEQTMVDIIERCWIYNPDERIDIFGVVQILREAVKHFE